LSTLVSKNSQTLPATAELGRAFGCSKEAALLQLKYDFLGSTRVSNITRGVLLQFAKRRVKQGAAPVTLGIDISFIGTVIEHAAAIHGLEVSIKQARLARIALNRLGLVARSNERDVRPTSDEIAAIVRASDTKFQQIIPVAYIRVTDNSRGATDWNHGATRRRSCEAPCDAQIAMGAKLLT